MRPLALAALATLVACTPPPLTGESAGPAVLPDGGGEAADNHATLPTTTLAHRPATTVRASRGRVAEVAPDQGPPGDDSVGAASAAAQGPPSEPDFWRRLAMCESGMRVTHNRYVGFFQFSADTAAKVGIDGSESYEAQRAAAQEWARRIHPREGTTAGWPVCWWRAA